MKRDQQNEKVPDVHVDKTWNSNLLQELDIVCFTDCFSTDVEGWDPPSFTAIPYIVHENGYVIFGNVDV